MVVDIGAKPVLRVCPTAFELRLLLAMAFPSLLPGAKRMERRLVGLVGEARKLLIFEIVLALFRRMEELMELFSTPGNKVPPKVLVFFNGIGDISARDGFGIKPKRWRSTCASSHLKQAVHSAHSASSLNANSNVRLSIVILIRWLAGSPETERISDVGTVPRL